MASTDARPVPRKNVAYRVTFPIYDADGDLVTGASSPDSEVSIDGGTFADCANEATEIATNSGMYFLDLTSGEMNGDTIAIIVKSGTGKTTAIVMYPEEVGDYRADVVMLSGDATAADNAEAFFDGTGYAGTNNVMPTTTTVTNQVSANVTAISGDATAADNLESYTDGTTPIPANVTQIDSSATAADRLERAVRGNVLGTVTTGSSTTSVIVSSLSPASSVVDQFKGRIMTFDDTTTTAALRGQATDITAFNHATQTFTVTALTNAPASGDTFTIT